MPAWLLIALDLIALAMTALTVGPALAATAVLHQAVAGHEPYWVQALLIPPCGVVFLLFLLGSVALLSRLLPTPRAGTHAVPSRAAALWTWHFFVQRIAMAAWWREYLFASHTLRFLLLRALRSQVAFHIQTSSDAALSEAYLVRVERGAMLAQATVLSGHLFDRGQLTLGELHIGAGAAVLAGAQLAPGVHLGRDAVVGVQSLVGPCCRVEDGAVIGGRAVLVRDVVVGAGARVGAGAFLEAGVRVAPGARVGAGERVPRGAHVGGVEASA